MSGPLRRLLPVIGEQRATFVWTVVSNAAVQLGALTTTVLGTWLAGRAAATGTAPLAVVATVLCGLAVVTAAMTWRESWVSHDLAYRLIGTLRARVFDRLRVSLPDRRKPRRSGDLVSVAFADIDRLEWLYAHTAAQALTSAMMLAATATLSLMVTPWLLLAWVPFVAVTAALPWLSGRAGTRQGTELTEAAATLNAELVDTVRGLGELSSAGALDRRTAALAERTRALTSVQTRIGSRIGGERAVTDAALALGALGALAVCAANLDTIDRALAPVAMVLATAALGPIAQISDLLRNVGTLRAAGTRITGILDRAPAVREPRVPRPLPPRERATGLVFDRVSFGYRDDAPPVLSDVSFTVRPGERVGLTGPSGAGKTTCALLATRMWDPDAGHLTLDGVDLTELSDDDLRRAISAVPQEPGLLTGTIATNIRLGKPEAGDAEVERAARRAGILDPGAGFPAGLATTVGESGAGLSGGQRARVAVARALLVNPRILILDEATANLDPEADEAITAALASAGDDIGVLVIAHRPATLAGCHRVVALREGGGEANVS
ncbi:ABC transporter ATP-binding protein/permease [Amycolatopsis roodepoortensis]|uniref:ABC transporter ATP-binding protein n=1 Tax=Amycolatopsis roodepoortensis TaxID=700274 RepID=UPI00214BC3F5|nr:ABC transporter ATP-binding protein [Amycolatopsis roodepoortensis]UUV33047.1 ABC transporter ATP-binding protein/permease [Amycolatopsis roodepoortensis]